MWAAGGKTPRQTLAHDGWVRGAAWNGDESLILTWSGDRTAKVWAAGGETPRQTLAHDGEVDGAAWRGDRKPDPDLGPGRDGQSVGGGERDAATDAGP